MDKKQLYWLLISFYGAIHVNLFLKHIGISFPIYSIYIALAIVCFLLYKYINIEMKETMNLRIETIIWFVQSLVIVLNSQYSISYWSILYLLLFVFLEMGRITLMKETSLVLQENNDLYEQLQHYNELFQVVRSERHDFLKHIAAIQFIVDKGEGGEEAKRYLSQLVEGYAETNLSIKGENGAVASILHRIYKQAQEKNIDIMYDFDVPLSTLPMKEKHIVELIGNILSNSLEACEEFQIHDKKQAEMVVRMTKRSGFYLLSCKNSSMAIPESIVDFLFVKFVKSTKRGQNRGYGTKIIYKIVRDHQGYLDYTYKESSFYIKIKIPAIIKK